MGGLVRLVVIWERHDEAVDELYRKTRFSCNEFIDRQGANMVNFLANYEVNDSPCHNQCMVFQLTDISLDGSSLLLLSDRTNPKMVAPLEQTKLTVPH